MTMMARCPKCDRLYIYWNGDAADPTAYTVPAEEKGKLTKLIERLNQP
jgi:hypothetical protein